MPEEFKKAKDAIFDFAIDISSDRIKERVEDLKKQNKPAYELYKKCIEFIGKEISQGILLSQGDQHYNHILVLIRFGLVRKMAEKGKFKVLRQPYTDDQEIFEEQFPKVGSKLEECFQRIAGMIRDNGGRPIFGAAARVKNDGISGPSNYIPVLFEMDLLKKIKKQFQSQFSVQLTEKGKYWISKIGSVAGSPPVKLPRKKLECLLIISQLEKEEGGTITNANKKLTEKGISWAQDYTQYFLGVKIIKRVNEGNRRSPIQLTDQGRELVELIEKQRGLKKIEKPEQKLTPKLKEQIQDLDELLAKKLATIGLTEKLVEKLLKKNYLSVFFDGEEIDRIQLKASDAPTSNNDLPDQIVQILKNRISKEQAQSMLQGKSIFLTIGGFPIGGTCYLD